MMRTCIICGREFQARGPKKTCGPAHSEQHRDEQRKLYAHERWPSIKDREREKQRARRAATGNAYDVAYREKHRDVIRERNRLWAQAHKEEARARWLLNRDEILERKRLQRAAMSDDERAAISAMRKEHYRKRREEWLRVDRLNNPEKYRALEARISKKDPEYARLRYAKRAAALRLVRQLQNEGEGALL